MCTYLTFGVNRIQESVHTVVFSSACCCCFARYLCFYCLALARRQHWLASTFHGREHTSIQSTQHTSACRRFVPCSQSTSRHLQSSGTQTFQDRPCRGLSDATLQSTLLTTLAERPLAVFPCRLCFDRATPALYCCLSLFCIILKLLGSIQAGSRVFIADWCDMLLFGLTLLFLLQRQFAFEAAFHCIDEAYKAKGPFLKHACHFRAERCDHFCSGKFNTADILGCTHVLIESSNSLTSSSMDCRYTTLKRALNLKGDLGTIPLVANTPCLSTGSLHTLSHIC